MSFVIDMLISDGILEIDCSANFMDDTLSFTHNNGLKSYYDYSGIILNDINKNTLLNIDGLVFNNSDNLGFYSEENINLTNANNVLNINTNGIKIKENINKYKKNNYSIINNVDNGYIPFDSSFDIAPIVVINQESEGDIIPLNITSITNNGFYWKSSATGINRINYIAFIHTSNTEIQTNTININDISDNGFIPFDIEFNTIPVVILCQESEGDIIPLNITSITNNGFYWKSSATGVKKINYIANTINLSNPEIQTDIVNINDLSDNGYIQFNNSLMTPLVLINRISNEDIIYLIVTSVTNNGFYWKSSATGVKQINYNAYSIMNTNKSMNLSTTDISFSNSTASFSLICDYVVQMNINGNVGETGNALLSGGDGSIYWGTITGGTGSSSSVNTSLANYATNASVNASLANYAKITSVNASLLNFATNTSVNASLANYAKITSVNASLANYVTSDSINDSLLNYVTNASVNASLLNYVINASVNASLLNYATNTSINASLLNYATNASVITYINSSITSLKSSTNTWSSTNTFTSGIKVPSLAFSNGNLSTPFFFQSDNGNVPNVSSNSSSNVSVYFNVPFNTTCIGVSITNNSNSQNGIGCIFSSSAINTSGFVVRCYNAGTSDVLTCAFQYLAYGY